MSDFDTTGIPEGKGTSSQWLDSVVHESIGILQIDLTVAERKALVDDMAHRFGVYEKLVLSMKEVRQLLYARYSKIVALDISEGKLSRNFNTARKGNNSEVKTQINSAFRKAWDHEEAGRMTSARIALQRAELGHKVLFGNETVAIAVKDSRVALELEQIRKIKEKLFHSIIKMAAGVAKEHALKLRGCRVECSDLVQEAYIASMEAVEAYHPFDSGETFTTFSRNWISGALSKRVSETTRTVTIPRSVIDRFDYVGKAIDRLKLDVSDLRGGVCQGSMLVEGWVSYDTLCEIAYTATALQNEKQDKDEEENESEKKERTQRKPFPADEVMDLLMVTQDTFSLEMKIESQRSSDGQEPLAPEDTLIIDAPSVEDQIDGALVGKRLMVLIGRFTRTTQEYQIMKLRWGTEGVIGYNRVSNLYCAGTGKAMNKTKVRKTDKEVLARVREAVKNDPKLARQFREIIETLQLQEKNRP